MQRMRRTKLVSLAVCVAALLNAPNAEARQLVKPPAVDALILHQPCPVGDGTLTCAFPAAGIIYLAHRDRFALEHERGHIFDAQILTPETRRVFTRLLGYAQDTPWAPATGDACSAVACPWEVFADAYAACRIGMRRERWRGVTTWETAYGYYPTPARHYLICATMRRVYFRAFGLARVTRDRGYPNRLAHTGRIQARTR